MTQVLSLTRATKSLLFAALLLGPTLLAVVPSSPAQVSAGCVAAIERITVKPSLWVNRGDRVTVEVFVNNTESAVAPTGNPTVWLNYTVQYANGALAHAGTKNNQTPPFTFSFAFDASASDADVGQAKIYVQLNEGNSLPSCAIPPTTECTPPTGQLACKGWGFWLDQKPDLRVKEIHMLHPHLDEADDQQTHLSGSDVEFEQADLFTRYPTVTDATGTAVCLDEDPATAPGKFHFNLSIANDGTAGFYGPDGHGSEVVTGQHFHALPLTIRVLDAGVPIGNANVQVAVQKGGEQVVTLTSITYVLLARAGIRNVTFVLDPLNQVPEVREDNNVFSTLGSGTDADYPNFLEVKAPDLNATLDVREVNGKVSGKWGVKNTGKSRAGEAPTGNTICHSANGKKFEARVYLNSEIPESLIGSAELSLNPGDVFEDDDDIRDVALGAGINRIIVVPDANRTIVDANETNDRFIVEFARPDVDPPVLSDLRYPFEGRAGAAMNITGNVSDDADFSSQPGNSILLDFTYPDGSAHTFTVPRPGTAQAGYALDSATRKVLWWFNASYPQPGEYTFRARAVDSGNHTATLPALESPPARFLLAEFPKGIEKVSVVACQQQETAAGNNVEVIEACAENHINWTQTQFTGATNDTLVGNYINLTFRVPPGSTGLLNESKNAARKSVVITNSDGASMGNFSVEPVCFNMVTTVATGNATEALCTEPSTTCTPAGVCQTVPGSEEVCTDTSTSCFNHTFRIKAGLNHTLTPLKDPGCGAGKGDPTTVQFFKPGPYNLTVWVGDATNPCRFRPHGSVDGQPATPLISFQLWAQPTGKITRVSVPERVEARQNAILRAHLRDDFTIEQGAVLLRRGADPPFAVNMALIDPDNATLHAIVPRYNNGTWQGVIPTGFGTQVDRAGDYRVLIGHKDANHTWAFNVGRTDATCVPFIARCDEWANALTLRLVDTRDPSITNARTIFPNNVASDQFQVGSNLAIVADVEDDTAIAVRAEVVNSTTGATMLVANMTQVAGTLYSTGNITTGPGGMLPEGVYRYTVIAEDSAGNTEQISSKLFTVAANLPPAFTRIDPPDRGFGRPGGRVTVELSDNLHGVRKESVSIRMSVDGGAAEPVSIGTPEELEAGEAGGPPKAVRAAFNLPSSLAHGAAVELEATATDGTNLTGSRSWKLTIDAQGPRSALTCEGSYPQACGSGSVAAVRGDAAFRIEAEDPDTTGKARSNVSHIEYQVESGTVLRQARVDAANVTFTLGELGAPDGVFTVRHKAVDRAGNAELPERSAQVILDTRGPQIQNVLVTPTASGWNISASIRDVASDEKSARLLYRTDVTAYEAARMEQVPGTKFWFANVPGARRGVQVSYYLEATDFLGNVATNGTATEPLVFRSENHPPQLTLVSPRDGEEVGGSVTVRWQTTDLDGDPVTVAISYRRQGDTELVRVPLSSEEQGARTKILDTSRLVDGTYTLTIVASDNQAFNNRTTRAVNITVGGEGTEALRPSFDKASVGIGEDVVVRVEIARAVREVEARLLRDGREVAVQEMEQNPPGTTTWEAVFRVSEPGVYEAEVTGRYADGTPFQIKSAGTLTVQGGGLAFDLVAMVLLTVVVVAVAAVGLRRRGWP